MNYDVAIKIIEYLAVNKDFINITILSKKIKENVVTTHRTILELLQKNLITIKPVGKTHLVFLNKTAGVYGFLTLAKSMKDHDPDKITKEVKEIYNKIDEKIVI